MIKALLFASTLISTVAMAVDGYDDHYLDRESPLFIHSILCGDLNNLATLKPAYVYSNSATILDGTYYLSTKYGDFSYTFKGIDGQPEQLKLKGLLTAGQTKKEQMKIEQCVVKALDGAPPALNSQLKQIQLQPDDANWATTMEQYALVAGRPAFGAGQYQDPRASDAFAQYDREFEQHNLSIIADLEAKFAEQSTAYQQALPAQFKHAFDYAKQHDGDTIGKEYPRIAEPLVWTATSKERYDDQLRMQQQERAYDELIQQTFDWLFSQVDKNSELVSAAITEVQPAVWIDAQRKQTVLLTSQFSDGRSLQWSFTIGSEAVNAELFEPLAVIEQKSHNKRQSLDIQRNQPRAKLAPYTHFDVYSPVAKDYLFFSQFRADASLLTRMQ